VEEAYSQREELRHFDRIAQEKLISDFREMDSNLFNHAQEALVSELHNRMPNSAGAGEVAIIRKEMNKKRRHLAIRKLIQQAGRAIQQVKPVFMMSPMSVATYLEQGAVEFDLVVFDEASQVKVVDAMGSILRGKQVVVVGDTKQMPPTDFFGKAIELDDEEAEESETADIESILGMFLSQGAPEVMLRWHYRSRHDSLIAVSNEEFYDGKLMIFPSPGVNPQASGLKYRYLPDTQYERGGSRTNPGEARAVAEAVMEHATHHPDLTLGVVAFSTAQRDRILMEVERLRRERPEHESFFTNDRPDGEGFFVKNLENVQGDERDIIYISIAYGRTTAGNISQSFGPVNREGGERRLNVLITRARLGMEVFTNLTADDLKITATSPFGVKSLRNFLKFAESGNLERPNETGKDTDSPFEDEVLDAIRKMGYDVEPQVGSAGFFIDMAVRDPNKPGRYVLAVECDGAQYHSSASARDRDRLRQAVLEGLGWRFHRIWSTDWFRNPLKESERLDESIKHAIADLERVDLGEEKKTSDASPGSSAPEIQREVKVEEESLPSFEYRLFTGDLGIPVGIELHELSNSDIHEVALHLLNAEGPLHIDQLSRRVADSAGVGRVGGRIAQRILEGVKSGARAGKYHFENSFIYFDNQKKVEIRDRSSLSSSIKKIEHVPSEEISEAVLQTVKHAFSLPRSEAISEALSSLGFRRSTQKASSIVNDVIDELVESGKLVDDHNTLVADSHLTSC
jgi:very-short-patch-repair endonuclease